MTITNKVSLKSVNGGNTVIADVVDAPTIGVATAGVESATVAYTAATTGGAATSFTAISTPGSITGTGASPITVSGLTGGTAYTFKVYGTNASGVWSGVQSSASNSVTPLLASSFYSIASTTLSGSSSTITFSSIPSTYQHLQLRFTTRDTAIGTARADVRLRFNNVSTSSYVIHYLNGDGATAIASYAAANTYLDIYAGAPRAGTTANTFSGAIVDIHDYASTTKNKTVRSFSGTDLNGSGNVTLQSGLFLDTSAITTITLVSDGNAFASGSVFALYGVKGA